LSNKYGDDDDNNDDTQGGAWGDSREDKRLGLILGVTLFYVRGTFETLVVVFNFKVP
jgi:hypothetical protein